MNHQLEKFDSQFYLYLTTQLKNPKYQSNVCQRVTVINFTATLHSINEQLLYLIMKIENQKLEL